MKVPVRKYRTYGQPKPYAQFVPLATEKMARSRDGGKDRTGRKEEECCEPVCLVY